MDAPDHLLHLLPLKGNKRGFAGPEILQRNACDEEACYEHDLEGRDEGVRHCSKCSCLVGRSGQKAQMVLGVKLRGWIV